MKKFKMSRRDLVTVIMRLIDSPYTSLYCRGFLFALRQAVYNYGDY